MTAVNIRIPQRFSGLDPFIPGLADQPLAVIKEQIGLDRVVKMSFNENPLGPSPLAIAAATDAVRHTNRYPAGPGEALRRRLALHLGVSAEQVILSNGADDMISMVAQLLEPGDEAVIPSPTFGQYAAAVRLVGGIPIKVPLIDYHVDLTAVQSAIKPRTKIVFLCDPNNPTGQVIPFTDMSRFATSLPESITLVVDEAYYEFNRDPQSRSAVNLVGKTPGPVVVIRTFSKVYALAALRIGYGISSAEVIRALDTVRLPFNVNGPAQAAAIASLDDTVYLNQSCTLVWQERERLYQRLSDMAAKGVRPLPTQANFLLVEFPWNTDNLWLQLAHKGVIVRRGSDVGYSHTLRVTVGLPEENDLFISALQQLLP